MSRSSRLWRRISLVWLACLIIRGSGAAATNPHVVVITMDGVGAYNLSDPNAPLSLLRRLASEGAVAEGVRISNPAVTWPNHTTLVTGVHPEKHSVLFNGVLTRPGPGRPVAVDPARDKADLVAVPTLYDRLHAAGYRTADINWPCTRGATTLEDSFPDVPDPLAHMTPRLRDELIARRILEGPGDDWFKGRSASVRDQIWTAAAAHVLRERQPNLLLFHMLVCDSIQHKYGPQSPAAYVALAQADAQLAAILQTIEAAGLRESTTVIVTADHGFDTATRVIQPNVAFRKSGLIEVGAAPGFLRARAQSIAEGGTAFVYLTDPASRDADRARVLELMRGQEGVADVLTPGQFPAWHLPDPARSPGMADLVLVARPGYAFGNEGRGEDTVAEVTLAFGSLGYHGFLTSNSRMRPIFVAWGRGIRPGVKLGLIDNTDVAPTVAHLLGAEMPGTDGRVLTELLADPRP